MKHKGKASGKLKEREDLRYKSILNKALIGICFFQDNRLIYVNSYIENLLKYSKEELLELDIATIILEKDRFEKNVVDLFNGVEESSSYEYTMIKKDGSEAFVKVSSSIIKLNNKDVLIGTLVDVTTQRLRDEKTKYKTSHDDLTGLYNRHSINKFIETEIIQNKNKSFGIIFIDLDRFKMINDSLGHTFGDQLLVQVANRLSTCVGQQDVISRYGGDEFIILLKETEKDRIEIVCKTILDKFPHPFFLNNRDVFVLPSMGISMYPMDSDNRENLIQYADNAMYFVKEHGGNNYKFYDSNLSLVVSKKFELESDLRQALIHNEFELYYQPLYDLKTNDIICFEALIRWNHPLRGLINPLDFIPLAEEVGLIIPIGNWVIDAACKQISEWNQLGHDVKVAVNVSYSHFAHESFLDTLKNTIEKTGVLTQSLHIEVTESVMQHNEKSINILEELSKLGIKTSVDDFGTGYSSFSILKSSILRNIKIDREFIQDVYENNNSKEIVKTIINLGKNLQFDIVAEGIETKEQLEFLLEHNCFFGQGYLFNRPLPSNKIIDILTKEKKTYKNPQF